MRQQLQKLAITTVKHLLFHLPLRYQDRTQVTALKALNADSSATVEGTIQTTRLISQGAKRLLICCIVEDNDSLDLCFYHLSAPQQRALQKGRRLRCFGDVRLSRYGLQMHHPDYRFIDENSPDITATTLTPIYPTVARLKQHHWHKWLTYLWEVIGQQPNNQTWFEELLPTTLRQHDQFPTLQQALHYLHHPPADADMVSLAANTHPCQRRLAFEELLAHSLVLYRLRYRTQQQPAKKLTLDKSHQHRLLATLPFQLTGAQQRVLQEIEADLIQPHPMLRLIQGDVGSGKTIIAALASLIVTANHYQVALMVPTELLAAQHFTTLSHWLSPLGIQVTLLSAKLKQAVKKERLQQIANGDSQLVVGTHALFQKAVTFKQLALLIIDEQHRFGVHQRLALQQKGLDDGHHPHQLIMTATPIPRTLAMSAYADLDLSTIDELPPGRGKVTTSAISNSKREQVINRIHHVCQTGRQAYWVCTLIEASEVLQAQAADNLYTDLKQALPTMNIALIHGRMSADEKAQIMAAFKAKQFDLLVATTVIEVGVDVPNASLMIIENAERLGLSQLHQLRGRVGRGNQDSHCLLLYQSPLSANAKKRLDMMRRSHDGFAIAELDLSLRGPGELLGTRQTGLLQMRIASLTRDSDLLTAVRQAAQALLQQDPDRADRIIQRWLGDQAEQFARV